MAKKKIILVLCAISILVIGIAYFYYKSLNNSLDPRLKKARLLYNQYSQLIEEKKYPLVFIVLDDLENIYKSTPGYTDSYELGVIYNNKAATYILMALYDENKNKNEKNELLEKASKEAQNSIIVYENWLSTYELLSKYEIKDKIKLFFISQRVLNKRVDDLVLAKLEVKRRLSVSYTNLGIAQRHLLKQNEALESQEKALFYWPDNHTAKNNLNILFGKEPQVRSVIDKLFPKPRRKPSKNELLNNSIN